MSMPLHLRSITELRDGLTARDFSTLDLVQSYLDRIEAYNANINGFVTLLGEQARDHAVRLDRQRIAGEPLGPLAGVPIGVKDSLPTAGIRTTANSRVLKDWVPTHDAAAVKQLRDAGVIILGKTNLNEFGWALPDDHDLTPKALNPWNPDYAAIGSSSGSGSVVAAGFVAASVGTDGGGSARLPAGQNNLVSIKATHGLVSRKGMDDSWISDIAPMTRTVTDAALLLAAMSGGHSDESGVSRPSADYVAQLDSSVKGWRIGVPRALVEASDLEPEVAEAFEASLDALRRLGVVLVATFAA
jgi:aspartyl-tRNA(Asn)/glutamyl-tRNA(Gln) amidotransferase subunit A